jgi:hypothetical protein
MKNLLNIIATTVNVVVESDKATGEMILQSCKGNKAAALTITTTTIVASTAFNYWCANMLVKRGYTKTGNVLRKTTSFGMGINAPRYATILKAIVEA